MPRSNDNNDCTAYRLTDDALIDAFEHTAGEPGDPVADALIDEIEARGLDV